MVRTVTNGGKIADDVKKAVWARDKGRCRQCKKALTPGVDAQYDHIRPWSKGGTSGTDNVQMLCKRCNLRKGARLLAAYSHSSLRVSVKPSRQQAAVNLLSWAKGHQDWYRRIDWHFENEMRPWMDAHPEREQEAIAQVRQTVESWVNAARMMASRDPNNAALLEYAQKCHDAGNNLQWAAKCPTCKEVFLGNTIPAAKALAEEHGMRMHGWPS